MKNYRNNSSKSNKKNKTFDKVPSAWKTNKPKRKKNYDAKFDQDEYKNFEEQTLEISEDYHQKSNFETEINSDIKTLYEDKYKSYLSPKKNKFKKFIISLLVILLIGVFITIYLYSNNNELFNPLNKKDSKISKTADNSNENNQSNTLNNDEENKTYKNSSIENIIGINIEKIKNNFGNSDRLDKNEYNEDLLVYNSDYNNYVMISYDNNNICSSFFTMSKKYSLYETIKVGSSKLETEKILDKNNYLKSENDENIWINDDYELDLFYDTEDNTVSSFQINTIPSSKAITFDEENDNEDIDNYLVLQMFDLINIIRLNNNKNELTFSTKASKIAYNHSEDMIKNNYFSHNNLDGVKPFDRLKNAGIESSKVSENISAGHRNSIFVVETLMKSDEHKNNILGDFENIGIGIKQGGEYRIYFTQIYYSTFKTDKNSD